MYGCIRATLGRVLTNYLALLWVGIGLCNGYYVGFSLGVRGPEV
jgi:hypothetical protein